MTCPAVVSATFRRRVRRDGLIRLGSRTRVVTSFLEINNRNDGISTKRYTRRRSAGNPVRRRVIFIFYFPPPPPSIEIIAKHDGDVMIFSPRWFRRFDSMIKGGSRGIRAPTLVSYWFFLTIPLQMDFDGIRGTAAAGAECIDITFVSPPRS